MPSAHSFGLFFSAALILAVTPGPGILYVLTRSLSGGRCDGIASSFGTAVGGLGHVLAAALGLSAILATSALAFGVIKWMGAAYLMYLGIHMLMSQKVEFRSELIERTSTRYIFMQGILTEVLNPKTALFFLAFLPQFINPYGPIVLQFLVLGSISVGLNTSVDLVVATFAGPIGQRLQERVRFRRGQRIFSGCALIALGTYVALANDPQ
ncbi:MAG: Threonine/homoserine/homoserine lactone efflux protein [Chloroflexi bacterium AL-W]|nr:Threonine/homoserine/homoserine lactone efflux protein [Chloroflexi bacterium AL-N1]NOK70603.1 Threonine/homoserine/homoserine lactone efflux protein [Chloroflexi bacterium AL-N10]NOK77595.1 Threonine/homoserine/homoserine lactone efflux protein [Chloroflexi bacterium AL-N5]NOK84446.1 Threonine/homoserine/homoserine lactone efflux protein [Chloroflexi bacterium AL-W]NOK92335.1 Threonine/homoserine/homoserine lactone efflux protein [Chloroflexi bacterium AL-N15]